MAVPKTSVNTIRMPIASNGDAWLALDVAYMAVTGSTSRTRMMAMMTRFASWSSLSVS